MVRRTAVAASLTSCLAAAALVPFGPTAAAAPKSQAPTVTNDCITSVPDPGTTAPVQICYTIFKPAGADKGHRVPVLMHSHGWGGSRTTDPASFQRFLDAGYGVISFDQRGFGESGGQAYVENPDVEGHDVRGLVDVLSKLRWVEQDGPGDPHMGAIGGSYGGGYQFLTAFEELRTTGKPVLDAMAPEITWNDLSRSLAPEGVVRDEWALALSAAAVPSDALPHNIYAALVEGAATGTWPDGSIPGTENLNAFFEKNGPKWHVDHGRKLDIPVLFGQGTTDGLFNLEQGLTNWRTAITDRARSQSIFVGYNGGHVLPSVYPQGVSVTSDPCSKELAGGNFQALSIKFFDETLKGIDTGLGGWGQLHIATPDSTCTTISSPDPNTEIGVGTVASPTAAGPAIAYKIADGGISIAGSSYLTGNLTALPTARAFFGLAVGTSPADAHLVQNNVMPLNVTEVSTAAPVKIELPATAVDVPAGQSLYLLVSAVSDTFVGMSSRAPGVVVLDQATVHLPVLGKG
jgi:ABC-2 type transport system ATP-binding protein